MNSRCSTVPIKLAIEFGQAARELVLNVKDLSFVCLNCGYMRCFGTLHL